MTLSGNGTVTLKYIDKDLLVKVVSFSAKLNTPPKYSDPNIGKILEDAADLIEKDGWVQGFAHKYEDGHLVGRCMTGAIHHVSNYHDVSSIRTWNWLSQYIKENNFVPMHNIESSIGPIIRYNDTDGREKFEVINLLRDAAKEWYATHE